MKSTVNVCDIKFHYEKKKKTQRGLVRGATMRPRITLKELERSTEAVTRHPQPGHFTEHL